MARKNSQRMIHGLAEAARQIAREERRKSIDPDINSDATFAYMRKNGVPLTLENYVSLAWMGDKTVEEVLEDGELAADLPEELVYAYEHGTKVEIQ